MGQFSVDGHAIFDNDDYDIQVSLSQAKAWVISAAGYTEFRSWYDGNGGFFPVNGQFFVPPNQEMELDRGEAWVELGLRMPKLPEITFHYSHQFREGQKDSTIWGDTILTGLPPPPPNTNNPTRKIAPAFRDIDETRDIFSLDILEELRQDRRRYWACAMNTVTWTTGCNWSAAQVSFRPPWQRPARSALSPRTTRTSLDSYNGHVTTETRLNDSLWFTTRLLLFDLEQRYLRHTHHRSGITIRSTAIRF